MTTRAPGKAARALSHNACVAGAEPIVSRRTEERSVAASRASSLTTRAIIVGMEVSAVQRKRPIASI